MFTQETISYILGILGLGGIIFTIYNHFKDPQTQLDKQQALAEKESDNKALLLAQQFQWEKEGNEKRFAEMQAAIRDSTTMAQNHIHTLDTKMTYLSETINLMNLEIKELSTIVKERFGRRDRDKDQNV